MKKFSEWIQPLREAEERELSQLQKSYQDYFKAKLNKYGVKSPADLSAEKKAEFFGEITKDWEKGQGASEAGKKDVKEHGVKESLGVNEADMTKFYDGFKVLDDKSGNVYQFKYKKGVSNTNVENDAISKLMKTTGLPKANFGVRGFINKGQWSGNEEDLIKESLNEARTKEDLEAYLQNLQDKLRKYKGVKQNSMHPFDPQKKVSDYVAYLETSIKYVKAEIAGLNESLNEAEIKSDDEFKEYAIAVLTKAFGEDFDQATADKTIAGILKKADGDYGMAVGMLTSGLGK